MDIQGKIIVADDHPLFRSALGMVLQGQGAEIVEAKDIPALQDTLEQHADIAMILLDLNMPGAEGFSGLVYVTTHYPKIPVLVVSANDSPQIIQRAMEHKAMGFLPKISDNEQIVAAINSLLARKPWLPPGYRPPADTSFEDSEAARAIRHLTPQQFRIATLLVQGLLNKQIAYELDIAEATVKAHMTEILRKLNVTSRTQAVLLLSKLGLEP